MKELRVKKWGRHKNIAYGQNNIFLKIAGSENINSVIFKKINSLYNRGIQIPKNSLVLVTGDIENFDTPCFLVRCMWSKLILSKPEVIFDNVNTFMSGVKVTELTEYIGE